MQRLRLWIRNIFGFSRGETNGFLILLPLMLLVLFSQPIYRLFVYDSSFEDSEETAKLDSLVANWDFNPNEKIGDSEIVFFKFDPNTATNEEFEALGLPSYLSRRIINYRSKGGRFQNPDDLLKIYGMDSSLFASISSYVSISDKSRKDLENRKPYKRFTKEEKAFVSLDLNLADTIQLKSVRGIGVVLANRIIKYRNALGGFWDLNQIKEVYGLDTAVVASIINRFHIEPGFIPHQLNVNNATEKEFISHPYIKSKLAKTIIAYRFQHGSFNEIDDLLKIDLIDKELLIHIRPYLKIEP